MSRETRFDKLESTVVDALRRAPGVEPSADLDRRILARAHAAVAKPAKRPQPIWFSMAAGLVVLVGSGLALRIWEQVERAPSVLDVPPPAASTPVADDGAAAADSVPTDADRERSGEGASPKREQPLPAAAPAERRLPTQPGAQLRRENIATESRLDSLSDLSANAPVADVVMPTAAPAARPFPAEPAPAISAEETAPMAAGIAASSEMVAPAPPAAPPPPTQPPAAAKVGVARAEAVAELDSAKSRAADGAVAAAAASSAGRDFASPTKPVVDEDRERQSETTIEPQSTDHFAIAVAAIRAAVTRGDRSTARTLALALQREYPERELPDDLQALVDPAQ